MQPELKRFAKNLLHVGLLGGLFGGMTFAAANAGRQNDLQRDQPNGQHDIAE